MTADFKARRRGLEDEPAGSRPITARPAQSPPLPWAARSTMSPPLTRQDVLALQRSVGNRATVDIIQRKAYSMSRSLPLEPHFTLKEPEQAEKLLLGKLRLDYPLDPAVQKKADEEAWSALQRDEQRGEEFAKRKRQVLARISGASDYYGPGKNEKMVWTPGAHVAGLSVASERERKNTPESTLTKDVTKTSDWIGAHLIKREWGGEDNMWNVVCWPGAAEKKWGTEFEEPIEVAFANQTTKKINFSVRVSKEDEAIRGEEVEQMVEEGLKGGPPKDERWRNAVQGGAITTAARANRGIERIPTLATGKSELGESTLTSAETKFDAAVKAAQVQVSKKIKELAAKAPHEKRPVPELSEVTKEQAETRMTERQKGWGEEVANYRSERYDATNPLVG